MKKIYLFLGCAALALPVMAENPQLPNAGFEDEWVKCQPFTSDPGNPDNTEADELHCGITPTSWTVANVIGYHSLGATQVGDKAEGYESATAVKLTNTGNPIVPTQIVPGYMALGTPWNCSVMGSENDGGTFGGVEFTGRPEKITFMYKFERDGENEAPASAVAYLWKGNTTQADVPAGIGLWAAAPTIDMVNRDRNILDMATNKGGEVTKSDDFELIAKGEVKITETTADWAKGEIVFEYYSDATPEMINVIFAANDYFTETVVKGNTLTVDNVECVYPVAEAGTVIEAAELTGVPGTCTVKGFTFVTDKAEGASKPIIHDDTQTLRLYANNTLTISGKQLNKITFKLNETGNKRYAAVTASTGTVSQQAVGDTEFVWTGDATDVTFTVGVKADYGTEPTKAGHVHVLSFEIVGEGATAPAAPATYNGNLYIEGVSSTPEGDPATITITPTGADKCTFLLPNFTIEFFGMPINVGDIFVEDVDMTTADGVTTYKGAVNGLSTEVGELDVTLEGTEDAQGKMTMNIVVNQGYQVYDCTFNGVKDTTTGIFDITVDENAPVEFYNLKGIRVNENAVAPGLYIRRQGNKATKVIIR